MALQVGELYSTLELRDDDFQKGMQSSEGSISSLASMLGPKGALLGAAAGVGAAFAKMAQTGAENIKELREATERFKSETGATSDEAERFSDTAQSLHKKNVDSYEELGDALTTLRQRQGDLGDQTEEQAQKFLDYAKVTGQDTPQAIKEMTKIQKSWGLEIGETNKVMDQLMSISQETGADVGSLQDSLAQNAQVMDALGISLEEGASLLGHFEDQGVSASKATRGLRNMMARLEDPTDAQVEAIGSLGVSLRDSQGNMRDTNDVFRDVFARLEEGELSSEQMAGALDLLGRRAGQDVVRGLKDSEAGVEEMMGVVEGSKGTVKEASNEYDKQLGERWTLIKRKYLHPFMEAIGEVLISTLEHTLAFIEKWGPSVMKVFETATEFLSGAFGEGGDVSGIMEQLKNIFKLTFELLKENFNKHIEALQLLWDKFGDEITATAEFVWDNVVTQIEMVLGIIEGLLETFNGVITGDFERTREGIEKIWDSLVEGITDLLENTIEFWRTPIKEARDAIIDALQKLNPLPVVRKAMGEVTDFLFQDLPRQMLKGGGKVIDALLDGILDKLREIPVVGDKAADKLAERLMGESPPPKGPLSDIDKGGRNVMAAWIGGLEDGIPAAESTAEEAADSVEKETNRVQEALSRIGSTVKDYAMNITTTIKDNIVDKLREMAGNVIKESEALQDVVSFTSDLMDSLFTELAKILEPVFQVIKRSLLPIIKQLAGIFQRTLRPLLQSLARVIGEKIIPTLANLIESTLPLIESLLGGLAPILGEVIEILATLFEAVSPLVQLMTELLVPAFDALFAVLKPVIEIIGSILKPALEVLGEVVATLANGIISILRAIIKAVNIVPGVDLDKPDYVDIDIDSGEDNAAYQVGESAKKMSSAAVASTSNKSTTSGGKEDSGGKSTANITIKLDGKTIARAVEEPLLDDIRIKGGVRF